MKETKNINVTKRTVSLAFKEFRDRIYKYLTLVYQIEILGDTNNRGFFAVDESLFGHRANTQIWILGIIESSTKKFCIERTFQRNTNTLKKLFQNLLNLVIL